MMIRILIYIICFLYIVPASSKNVFVSVKGNDKNNGSLEYPFKTLERAFKEIHNDSDSIIIYIRKGVYEQEKSLDIRNIKNVTLSAYKNEIVSISGGLYISKHKIKKVHDSRISSRFNKKVRNKIRCVDFNSLDINLIGLTKRGFAYKTQPSWSEFFIDGKPLQLSKWPNDNMVLIDSVINSGDIPSKEILGKGKPIITYTVSEPQKWQTVKGGWICGYFGEGWADDMLPLDSIDKENKTLTVGDSSNYGFKADGVYRRWYVKNLPEEIDLPGEYVVDQNSNNIYFLPYKKAFNNLQISILKEPILSISTCQSIIIKNIIIECSRGIGIQIDNSANILIDSCIFRNLGNIGVKINGNTSNSGVKNSYIYQTGSGGIELNGGNRKKLIAGNNFVKNCRIYDFNRIERSYRPGIHIKGVGNKISNVEIYNAPSMAIYIYGNNHTIEYVDIHHVCKEVHDQGAIYYGRDPTERGHTLSYSYFHDIKSPFEVTAIYHDDGACGMDIFGCIFNNISSAPVWIGGGQDITYTNNIFMNLPYVIQIDNRLQIWQSYAKWLQPNGEYDKKFKAVNYTHPPYSEAYPQLLEYWINNPEIPKRNIIKNNIFYNVDKSIKGDNKFLIWEKNYECTSNPGFIKITSPLQGFNIEYLKKQFPSFIPIPTKDIGCELPRID